MERNSTHSPTRFPKEAFKPLQDTSLLDRKRQMDPDGYGSYLRSKGDLFFWPTGGFFVVTSFHMARDALRDPALSCDRSTFFISRMPDMDLSLIGDFFSVIKNMMVMSDAPHHTKRRATAAKGFDQNLLESYRPLIEKTVQDLLEPLREEGSCEFVQEVAMHLPATILADLFEIPSPIRKDFYQWSNTMTKFFGGASDYQNKDGVEVNIAAQNMRTLFEGLIQERKARPKKDFLSIMLMMQEKMGLTDGEVISQAVMMLVAGTITTTDQICNNIYTFLTEPGLWQKVRSRPKLLATTIEELNRWDPGVSYLFRVAKRNTTIGETVIREGDVIFISNHAVNRDPSQFQNPHSIEPERKKNPHFAYGHGAHYCLGAPLARMQMVILFEALMIEFPELILDPRKPSERNHYSLAFSGFKSIHLQKGHRAI